ncbi:MAG: hypothetical protein ACRDL4_01320 [Thermoleophilaceae bacterium]
MRPRDPRRLIERERRTRARVHLVRVPQPGYGEDAGIGSKQVAEVTLPRSELDRIWSPEYLERLARTYWRFLTRVSLGVLRVLYTPTSREVVVLGRPFVLLRFRAPEYDYDSDSGTVTWPIDRGLLVARDGHGRGYLRLTVRRCAGSDNPGGEVTATITSEVVSFYPAIARNVGRWLYNQTQLRVHVIVTHAFLRSLANLELEPSLVGSMAGSTRLGRVRTEGSSRAARPGSPGASPGRGER